MDMSFNSWNIIAAVAENGSISQAANALNLTSSAVSHTVKKTEEEIGYPLFVRERNRFALTDNGKALLPYIQNYLKSGRALREESLRLKNTTEGTVCIASYNNIIKNWLPHVLRSFHNKYPNVKVIIRQSNDIGIMTWMEHGEIDLAIAFNDYFDSQSFMPLHKTPVVCFTPKDYVPRNGRSMTAKDLRDMPIILRANNFDKATNCVLTNAGIPFSSVFRIDTDESCYEYIRYGFGFRITASITYPPNSDINMYPIENEVTRIIGLITVFPQYISPSVNLFRKEILSFFVDNDLMNV